MIILKVYEEEKLKYIMRKMMILDRILKVYEEDDDT